MSGDRARGKRSGEQHHQLAAGGQHGVDGHKHEHGDQTVIGDPVGQLEVIGETSVTTRA